MSLESYEDSEFGNESRFQENHDLCNPWKNIVLPEGRTLLFFENSGPTFVANPRSIAHNIEFNWHALNTALAKHGVLETNEIPATDMNGKVLPGDTAYYVDSRIGIDAAMELQSYVICSGPELFSRKRSVASRPPEPGEMDILVSHAIDALGLRERITECTNSDTAKSIGKTVIEPTVYDTGL